MLWGLRRKKWEKFGRARKKKTRTGEHGNRTPRPPTSILRAVSADGGVKGKMAKQANTFPKEKWQNQIRRV